MSLTATNPLTIASDHIGIRVVDYAGTVAWYAEKLDFHLDVEWPFGDMQLAYMSNGSAKIEIISGATATPQAEPTPLDLVVSTHEGLNHFCLAVDDFAGTVATLRERGVQFVGEPFVVEEISRDLVFLKDNSNNLIELSGARA